jgi:hypothetical protein
VVYEGSPCSFAPVGGAYFKEMEVMQRPDQLPQFCNSFLHFALLELVLKVLAYSAHNYRGLVNK